MVILLFRLLQLIGFSAFILTVFLFVLKTFRKPANLIHGMIEREWLLTKERGYCAHDHKTQISGVTNWCARCGSLQDRRSSLWTEPTNK